MSAPGPGSMNSPRSARTSESISLFVCSFVETVSSRAKTGRVVSALNPFCSRKLTAASVPFATNSRTASSSSSSGSARTPASGRSNEAIIFSRSVFSPADEGRPKTCRPVGINRCSISTIARKARRLSRRAHSFRDLFSARISRHCAGRESSQIARAESSRDAASLHWIQILFCVSTTTTRALVRLQRDRQFSQLRLDLHLPERAQVQTAAPAAAHSNARQ